MPYRLARDTAVAWLLAAWPLLVGVAIAVFAQRFTSRSWRFAAGIPGGYNTWAGVLIACGALMLFALILHRRTQQRQTTYFLGLVLVAAWWLILAATFAYVAVKDPLANPLGVVVWGPLGALYSIWAWFEYQRWR